MADYTPVQVASEKIKKKDGDNAIALTHTKDILGWLGENRKPGQFLCGFSMETENMLDNSRAKLAKKNVDMIVANNLKVITPEDTVELPLQSKEEVAGRLLDMILERMQA